MSYHLFLTQNTQRPLNAAAMASLRQQVSASPVLSRCEVFATTDEELDPAEGRDVLTACLPAGTDEIAVERIFAELKQLAKAYGLQHSLETIATSVWQYGGASDAA